MEYVEFLRMRRALAWHIAIFALIALFIMTVGGNQSSVTINGHNAFQDDGTRQVSLGALAALAAFFGAIFASSAGTSLNRESVTRELSWTKPISRTMLALRYVLIDLAGVAIAYGAALLAIVAVLLRMHIGVVAGEGTAGQLALGLGVGLMWYGLVQVLTCMLPPGGRALSGILWPVALFLGAFESIPGAIGAIARFLDIFNPLKYMGGTPTMQLSGGAPIVPVELRTVAVWGFAVIFCAIAIALWPRKEA